MWNWVLTAHFAILVAIIGGAGYVAFFDADPRRADRAYLLFNTSIGVAMLRLYELGTIR